jgi:predicted transcriptional regulator YdeE
MTEPRIVERDAFTVVGLEYVGKNEHMEIPVLWTRFIQRAGEITNPSETGTAYGVCVEMSDQGEFTYLAGLAVVDDSQIPEGMTSRNIPVARYAVFTHRGSLATLQDTYASIYTKWLPEAGLQPLGYNFELYDDRFKDFTPESEFDIYVPIG